MRSLRALAAALLMFACAPAAFAASTPAPATSGLKQPAFVSHATGTIKLNSISWSGNPDDASHPVKALSMQLLSAKDGALFAKLAAAKTTIRSAQIIDALDNKNYTAKQVTVVGIRPADPLVGGADRPIVTMSIGTLQPSN